MTATYFSLEVSPQIPERLKRLSELSENLFYSWSAQAREIFYNLNPDLWEMCGHNPKLFLLRISQHRLEKAVKDRVFMETYNRVLAEYDSYLQEPPNVNIDKYLVHNQDLVAYFSLEFGFHESLPTYSGGLGILAGDHCKAASDLGVPLVAVGLLYQHGYFTQSIDSYGHQKVHYTDAVFSQLPINPVSDGNGRDVHINIELHGRTVYAKVWQAVAGHITLYLLDTNINENAEVDRAITYQLYGGDASTRIQQEILLGIGGVRVLDILGLQPTVWHINEGHAAFQIFERCRKQVSSGWNFNTALELVASTTVFTTHTPVPAGHDIFSQELIQHYFSDECAELGITFEEFMALGSTPSNQGGFNMTALALRGSRFHNGVSRIHGDVAGKMEAYIWPQIPPDDNPITSVTNGVHVPTFLAPEWSNLFDMEFGQEWRNQLLNEEYWNCIDEIPEYRFWSVKQTLKSVLIKDVVKRLKYQSRRNQYGDIEIHRLTDFIYKHGTNALIIGFARRFATYKRATLLFNDPDRLAKLLNNPERPVLLIFAGKAHPNDLPGQQLIHTIYQLSRKSDYSGRVILLEDYNLSMARRLVTGVDVWLNTPDYPLEASGTSGQKAGINGVLNLSITDGWWDEGYNGKNGWAIRPHNSDNAEERNRLEAELLMGTLENQVIPLFFDRNGNGFSDGWMKRSKNSMKTILPKFNSQRMVMDYVRGYYIKAAKHGKKLLENDGHNADLLANWKKKIHDHWSRVTFRRLDEPQSKLVSGTLLNIRVAVNLSTLSEEDVIVECLIGRKTELDKFVIKEKIQLHSTGTNELGETLFCAEFKPTMAGLQFYKLRIYPHHRLLAHAHETGCMIWL